MSHRSPLKVRGSSRLQTCGHHDRTVANCVVQNPQEHARNARERQSATIFSAAVLLTLLSVPAAWAQAADPSDIAEGGSLFRQKGNCQSCHGWAGDGRKMDSQMPDGANLRESTLDRQNLMMTIKCGRPGTGMPPFDKFAYSDGRCYGLKQADLRASGSRMPDPPATLQQREIDTIVDFLFAKVVKQGAMDHAKCIEYWGSEVEACGEFAK
jgi:mono/diheme cytochrome c family protein